MELRYAGNIGISKMDNILFLFTDQWQGDATGYAGHKVVRTPNLDRLAEKSVNFVNSFTVCPLCTPARAAIMTGLYPHQSGIIDNCDVGGSRQEYLPNSAYTWLDAMVGSGRKTGYFGKWHLGLDWQSSDKMVDFDICRIESDRVKHETRTPKAPVTERGQLDGATDLTQAKKSEDMYSPFYGKLDSLDDRFESKVAQRAMTFLEENREEPWCLTVSLVGPHFPNLNSEPFYSMYDNVDITLPENFSDRFIGKPWYQNRKWWPAVCADHFDEWEWKKTIRAYYGSITMMDYYIGQTLKKAAECSGGRKTRVIFTADHGEMAGAHSRFDKAAYFYEEVLKTPLLVCEDLCGTQGGKINSAFCSTMDVAQTFFTWAGAHAPNGTCLSEMKDCEVDGEQYHFSSYYKYNGHSFEIRTVRTRRYKYCFVPQDIDELYDLQEDPYELKNVSDDYRYTAIKEELRARVFRHMEKTGDYLLTILNHLPQAGCLTAPDYPALKYDYEVI